MEGGQEETIEQIRAEVDAIQKLSKKDHIELEEPPQPAEQAQILPAATPPKHIEVEEDDDEDDDTDYDDDEEKDNSQKLVMDLNEEDDDELEELEKDEKEPSEHLDNAELSSKNADEPVPGVVDSVEKSGGPLEEDPETIITLSDAEAEDDGATTEATAKPGKVQKRKSVGAITSNDEEQEHYRLKRRKINAEGAPKMPLTGYVRYMNDRREAVRKNHPNKNSIEVTKVIAEEWQALSGDVKGEYLKAAEADKQRYLKELHTFLKSRPDILASELAKNKVRKSDSINQASTTTSTSKSVPKEKTQSNDNAKSSKDCPKEKQPLAKEAQPSTSSSQSSEKQTALDKSKRKRTPSPPFTNATSSMSAATTSIAGGGPSTSAAAASVSASIITPTPGEIPIFTNEFLEHNKMYDMELRSLRKSKTDLEQQNFVLEKHVENMKCGVEKMQSENNELQEKNRLLEIYLDKLKRKLAQALGSLPLPSAPNGATVENIDKYMQDLYKMSTSNSHGPATLNKAKDIIRKLDLQIQL